MRGGEAIPTPGLASFGLASTALAFLGIALAPHAALTGWFTAALLLQAVPFGALMLLAAMRLVRGQWEEDLRCACEGAAGLWAAALLAFVPVLIGVWAIYDWPGAELDGSFREVWLSVVPFALRTLLWFAALAVVARSQIGGQASRGASALALLVMMLGGALLAADWLLSIGASRNSSAFGLVVPALEMCIAGAVVILLRIAHPPQLERPALLAWLLLALLLLRLYFQFLPWLFVGSGSLPDGAKWLPADDIWSRILQAIGALGIMPLFALLLPQVRRSCRAIACAAIWVLAAGTLEFGWAALAGRGAIAALTYLFAVCGLGCFAAAYLMPGRSGPR